MQHTLLHVYELHRQTYPIPCPEVYLKLQECAGSQRQKHKVVLKPAGEDALEVDSQRGSRNIHSVHQKAHHQSTSWVESFAAQLNKE